jgi:hypothetical protein
VIHRVLRFTRGNKSEAARYLKTDYKTLYLKMKQYDLLWANFRVFTHRKCLSPLRFQTSSSGARLPRPTRGLLAEPGRRPHGHESRRFLDLRFVGR